MGEPLFVKHRPKEFSELVGNEAVVKSIRENLGFVHVYLLYGKRGCGKTTLARLIGKALGVAEFDVYEMDAASTGGINEVREFKSGVTLKPLGGERKIYIIDECHRLTVQAQDALLKTLEEPPAHVYFVLCTTEPGKVASTVKSRAHAGLYEMKPLSRKDMYSLLDRVIKEENFDVGNEVKKTIVNHAEGIPREALGMLERSMGVSEDEALDMLKSGGGEDVDIISLCRALLGKGEPQAKWEKVVEFLSTTKEDPEKIRRGILSYMTKVVLGSKDMMRAKGAVMVMEELFLPEAFTLGISGLTVALYRSIVVLVKG